MLINVPIAKQHGSTGLTLAGKNLMGCTSNRSRMHTLGLSQSIAEINAKLRPELTVIDAMRILVRNGPSGGSLGDVKVKNTVIACTDWVAADTYADAALRQEAGRGAVHQGRRRTWASARWTSRRRHHDRLTPSEPALTDETQARSRGARRRARGAAPRRRAAGKPPAGCAAPSRSPSSSSSSTCCSRRCSAAPRSPTPTSSSASTRWRRSAPCSPPAQLAAAPRPWRSSRSCVALVAGRVWCGWICPLGTLLGWFRFRAARRLRAARAAAPARRQVRPARRRSSSMAALGSMTLLVLDPIALLTRTVHDVAHPRLRLRRDGRRDRRSSAGAPGSGVVTWFEAHLARHVLPVYQPHYAQAVALFLVFLAVVLLNVFADRFWCRYLCPLGALLGLVAKVQVLRPLVGDGCDRCGACARACRVGAIERGLRRPAATGAGAGARRRSRPRPRRHLRVHDVPRLPRRLPGAARR